MEPAAVVNVPPSIEYSPFSMLTGAAVLMPEMITVFDATDALRVASLFR